MIVTAELDSFATEACMLAEPKSCAAQEMLYGTEKPLPFCSVNFVPSGGATQISNCPCVRLFASTHSVNVTVFSPLMGVSFPKFTVCGTVMI